MLDRLNGMFAFVLVDELSGEVFAARDRAGEKPLYTFDRRDGASFFASEIKAFPGAWCSTFCPEAEAFEFDCLESTPFRDVEAFPPGCFTVMDRPERLVKSWWRLSDFDADRTDPSWSAAEAAEELDPIMRSAVRLRADAAVPVSLLISGGLDSAIIQAIAGLDSLYCCSFPEADSLEMAWAASSGGKVQPVTFGPSDLLDVLDRVVYHLDTPATWTAFCQWFLAKTIATDGGRIVLSGEGADELFGGYTRHRLLRWLDLAAEDPHLEPAYRPTRDHLLGPDRLVLARLLDRSEGGRCSKAGGVLDDVLARPGMYRADESLIRNAGRVEFNTTMQVLLRMADRMFAAFSLENRSPFLDYRVMEFSARLPDHLRVSRHESKPVLRALARRLGVPRVITDERVKKGLFIPWKAWRNELVGSEAAKGSRGEWDRRAFSEMMKTAWRAVHLKQKRSPLRRRVNL